jgi:hypothetical protein
MGFEIVADRPVMSSVESMVATHQARQPIKPCRTRLSSAWSRSPPRARFGRRSSSSLRLQTAWRSVAAQIRAAAVTRAGVVCFAERAAEEPGTRFLPVQRPLSAKTSMELASRKMSSSEGRARWKIRWRRLVGAGLEGDRQFVAVELDAEFDVRMVDDEVKGRAGFGTDRAGFRQHHGLAGGNAAGFPQR